MNFDEAFERLIDHEKGFQDDPNDRGNWTSGKIGQGELKGTKYGVSAMSYPGEDIRNLTLTRSKQLYMRDFWGPAGCDLVPEQVKFPLFDAAVHTSAPGRPTTAIRMLQRALGVHDDGVIGPQTMQAISHAHPYRLAMRFHGQRLDHLNNNPEQWASYGRGWAQRIAENLMEA
jgi:lysozyme family protein